MYGTPSSLSGSAAAWVRAVCPGRKGHLPAILDLEPQRAGGITRRAEAERRTAQHIANHESPRTTKLYDRRQEEISLAEAERIAI